MNRSRTGNGPEDIYRPEPATVRRLEPLTGMEVLLEAALDSGLPLGHMPGQFVEVSCAGFGECPISLSSAPGTGDGFELAVRKVGRVTAAIHRLAVGDGIGIRGPFGTHYPVDEEMKGKDLLFIGGGLGLAPLRSVIQYTLRHRKDYGRIQILLGARRPVDRLFRQETEEWKKQDDLKVLETVDRADRTWSGPEGVITTLLPKISIRPDRTAAVLCGPPIMYKFVITELHRMNISDRDIHLSLERHMKCGVGKCGHCQLNGLYVCQEGPVFRWSEIRHLEEAL